MKKNNIRAISAVMALALVSSAVMPAYADNTSDGLGSADSLYSVSENFGILGDKATPDSPTVISATAKSGKLTVKWQPVTGVDGYVLYRYSKSTGHYKYYIMNASDMSFTWDDYSDYKSGYRYYILSYVKDGEDSIRSEEVDFTASITNVTEASAPAAVTFVKATKNSSAVRIYWESQQCDGFKVYMLKDGKWTGVGKAKSGAQSLKISGLSAGTTYYFKVKAYNLISDGTAVFSKASDKITVTTSKEATVSAPGKAVITSSKKNSSAVRVYWDSLACDGYEIYLYSNGKWTLAGTADSSTTNFRISGLSASTQYGITVRGYNKNSSGAYAYGDFAENLWVTTNAATVKTPVRTYITKSTKSATAIRFYWMPKQSDAYEIYLNKDGKWSSYAVVKNTAEVNYKITGLTPGTKYGIAVRCVNYDSNGKAVNGEFSPKVWITTKAKSTTVTAPAKPVITSSKKNSSAVRIYWNKLNCDGVELYVYKGGKWVYESTIAGTSSNYRFDGLSSGTQYGFTLRGYNKSSDGTVKYGDFADNLWVTTK